MPDTPDLSPTLTGHVVRLEPLQTAHLDGLRRFALDPALWTYASTPMNTDADLVGYVAHAVSQREAGAAAPFAVVRLDDGAVVGSTRFGSIAWPDRRAEIGWTFYDPAVQGTAVNTDVKRTLFAHAFDAWDLLRVELKADARNARSRRAMAAVGATYEGTLRQHMRTADGGQRDSVYYSVLASEWPAVRAHLDARLARRLASRR